MNRSPTTRDRRPPEGPINSPPQSHTLELLAVAALGGLIVGASGKNGRKSGAARVAGLALLAIAARPLVAAAVTRAGARRRNVTFRASIEIERPVPDVFAFFKDFENFPRVIGAVRSVVDYQDGRSHWEVYTPSGGVLAWDAVVNKYVPNSVIAWESVVRSLVESSGVARFSALSPTRTRVDLSVTYHPLYTSLKDAVRSLLSPHPAKLVDAHLDHIRFYLESLPLSTPESTPPLISD
jgi:uncharacterized membrane protein